MIKIRIILFAALAEQFGKNVEIDLQEGATVSQLLTELTGIQPNMEHLLNVSRVFKGMDMLQANSNLTNNVEIAILPPSSGG